MEGGRDWWPTFDAKSRNAKILNSHCCRLGGCWWPSFDPESKNAKIPNSHFHRWKRGIESQLLMLSPKMLKSHIHIFAGGECWQPTFDAESKNAKKSQIHIFTGGRGGLKANF